ncbi:hypothetical protein GKN94_06340 [Candidatus Lucifugimonas marina]|jgi:hypothetical protein|uniref:hypothetical protein n=1 Tax=Candidatus Lucifugimonas marina TaxID=3038979 RepID=UPI0027A3D5D9|nr:hypothetical protein GKN94_06340 [SAR202 cluster bacterium JH545]
MNSCDLAVLSGWYLFEEGIQDLVPRSKGVYVFRTSRSRELTTGESDIVYIGRANGSVHDLRKSIYLYLRRDPSQKTKKRVGDMAILEGWEVGWIPTEDAVNLEKDLLSRFRREHGVLPQQNKNMP